MHQDALAKRNAVAQDRMIAAALLLAERHGIPAPEIPLTGRDTAVLAMAQREVLAAFLESLAAIEAPKGKK